MNRAVSAYRVMECLLLLPGRGREMRDSRKAHTRSTIAVLAGLALASALKAQPAGSPEDASASQSFARTELDQIPSGRDVWVVLQTVPGVLMDRQDVAGNFGAQQSLFVGRGAMTSNNVYNLDGVNITDMAALGGTPLYYDFDSFQEIQAATGGASFTQMTPGVQVNLVTKRGTNDVHGSARFFLARDEWQSQNLTPELRDQGATDAGRIDEIQDYGVEVGGSLWKDRAWLWGAYARNQIDLVPPPGAADKTTLEDANLKLQLKPTDSTSLVGGYTQNDKIRSGIGAGPTRPPETTLTQQGFDGHPAALFRGEVSQVVGSNLFLSATYSYLRAGFQYIPAGGTQANNVYADSAWHNSYLSYRYQRPQHDVGTTGSYSFRTGEASHDLKFGFSYREAGVVSQTAWPGNGNWTFYYPGGLGPPQGVAVLTRAKNERGKLFYYSGYLGDVVTFGSLTMSGGLRYDVQYGHNGGAEVPANPVIPDILPALSSADEPTQFHWKTWQPRIGATYALGADNKTLLRASYARFADQLGISNVFHDNPAALAGIAYYWNDSRGDHVVRRSDLDFARGPIFYYGFDPSNPVAIPFVPLFDPHFNAGTTDELSVGVDHEILADFVVGATYVHRRSSGIAVEDPCSFVAIEQQHEVCGGYLTSADYRFLQNVTGTLFDGTTFSQPLYGLKPGVLAPPSFTGERNRPDWSSTYDGIELTWQKRLSNHWMMRGNFTWNDWRQHAGPDGCVDPTNALSGTFGTSCPLGGSDLLVAPAGTSSGPSFQNVFINSRWSFNVAGLYELPWGFAISANIYGREGYPYIQWIPENPGDGLGTRNVLVTRIGAYRYPNLFDADLRLQKAIALQPLQFVLSIEVFNIANSATVLQRQGDLSAGYNRILETLNPRVVRAGARVSF
jgi:hypothetical protein